MNPTAKIVVVVIAALVAIGCGLFAIFGSSADALKIVAAGVIAAGVAMLALVL